MPDATMPTTLATRKPVNDQPYAAKPCRLRAAVGNAVATAIASNAMMVIRIRMPSVVIRYRGEKIESDRLEVLRFGSAVTFAQSTYAPQRNWPVGHRRDARPANRRTACSAFALG